MYRLLGVGWGRGATRRDPRLLFISVFFWHTSVLWDVIRFYGKKKFPQSSKFGKLHEPKQAEN